MKTDLKCVSSISLHVTQPLLFNFRSRQSQIWHPFLLAWSSHYLTIKNLLTTSKKKKIIKILYIHFLPIFIRTSPVLMYFVLSCLINSNIQKTHVLFYFIQCASALKALSLVHHIIIYSVST